MSPEPKSIAFSLILPLTFGPINHLSPAVLLFSHPTRGPNVNSGLCGVGNLVLCRFVISHFRHPLAVHRIFGRCPTSASDLVEAKAGYKDANHWDD
jgi:hypothetical protein